MFASMAAAFGAPPPPVPALPDTERRTPYSLSASNCNCALNIPLFGDGTDFWNWIEVWVNGVRVNYNDPVYGWTLTSPSGSLSTLPRPVTNAILTFNNVQTGTVQIVGARRPRRVSQFNENQGVAARDLNQALTDIVAQNRETWDRTNEIAGRGLFTQPGNTLGPLPLAGSCQNGFLGFDATGLNPICRAGGSGSGNVVGPVSSTVGHLAVFGNTTGNLIADGGVAPSTAVYNAKDYINGVDFTAGTTTALTLTSTPAANASVYAYFDGIRQSANTYSISGTTVTFNAAIPTDTQVIEIDWSSAATSAGVQSLTVGPSTYTGNVTLQSGGGIAITGSGSNITISETSHTLSVKDVGGIDDMTTVAPGTVTIASGTATLTCSACVFTSADVGKAIGINGAGAAGIPLVTTIAGFTDANHVTLNANASTTLSASAQYIVYGTDNTTFFNAAFAFANIVTVPPSDQGYLIAGQVVQPTGGKLIGYSVANASTQPPASGVSLLKGGSLIGVIGLTSSPFKYSPGSLYKGLTIYYPLQLPTQTTPTVYPETWTFPVTTPLTNANWKNIVCVNCFTWVNASIAHLEFQFENMVGAPIFRGILDDGSGGTDSFHRIKMSPYYWTDFGENIISYIQNNAVGITFGWIDHLIVDDVFMGPLNAGMIFNIGSVAQIRGVYGRISNYSGEGSNYGVFCTGTQNIGVSFSNVMLASATADIAVPPASSLCTFSFENLTTWGSHLRSVLLQSPVNLQINGFRFNTAGTVNFDVAAGAVASTIQLSGGQFDSSPSFQSVNGMNSLMLTNIMFGAAPTVGSGHTIYRSCANFNLASSGC